MPDAALPILHHYASSPFSEKVRLAFGLKGLAWQSVDIPVMMPKPDLTPLTGGYRRTPVLQIGADIYCDTQLILRELDRRWPERPLVTPAQAGISWMVSMWADRQFFAASVPVIFGAIGYNIPDAFKRDREQLSGRPFDVEQMKQAAPMMRDQWRGHAAWVEQQLAASGAEWLAGEAPGLIDIAAHMNFWFLRGAYRPTYDQLIAAYHKAEAWAERVDGIGHGTVTDISASDAMAIAKDAAPDARSGVDPREPQGLRAGDFVTISADDYGRDPVYGKLVFSDDQEIAILRQSDELGDVVVHFPRVGYLARRG
jgi:glutathione S-transferase